MQYTSPYSNEYPKLIGTSSDFSVLYAGKYLYSRYNPAKSIRSQVAALTVPKETVVLVFSPLLGYGLSELAAKVPQSSYILAIEYDPHLMNLSLSAIPQLICKQNFSYMCSQSVQEVLKKIRSLAKFPFKQCITLSCSGGAELYREFYDTVQQYTIKLISQFWLNRITMNRLGRNYARNIFSNLITIAEKPHTDFLPSRPCINKPVLVTGAGPSLDTARSFIKANRTHFFLLAVDAAVQALLPDICPDAIVLVESQYWIDPAFIGLKSAGIPLFADLTASPRVVRTANSTVHFFCTEYAPLRFLSALYTHINVPVQQPLGSVGLTALELALQLTPSFMPIFHTGLDFSWGKGLTHALDASPIRTQRAAQTRIKSIYDGSFQNCTKTVTGKQGKTCTTLPNLIRYADLYRHMFAVNKRIIDIGTEGCSLTANTLSYYKAAQYLHTLNHSSSISTAYKDCHSFVEPHAMASKQRESIIAYLKRERQKLISYTNHLQHKAPMDEAIFTQQIQNSDYLYAHFPDAARGYTNDLSFLKRIRLEIIAFQKILSRIP